MEINTCTDKIIALRSVLDTISNSKSDIVKDALLPSASTLVKELNDSLRELTNAFSMGADKELTIDVYKDIVDLIATELSRFAVLSSSSEALGGNAVSELSSSLIDAVPPELQDDVREALTNPKVSDRAFTLDSSVMKRITRPKAQKNDVISDIVLSSKANATITVYEGYITPYERELLEAVYKAKQDGQVSQGKIFCTIGQIYKSMRGGLLNSPNADQKESILNDLKELSSDSRKIKFELANSKEILGDFQMTGGRLQIMSFNEIYGKLQGKDETLIIFEDTPFLIMVSDQLKMFESFSQKIKVVQEPKVVFQLANGITIEGKSDEECLKSLFKYGFNENDVVEKTETLTSLKMTKGRISLRNAIISFIYSYYRTRGGNPPKPHSNKINYNDLFDKCEVGPYRSDKKSAKEFVKTVMEHLRRSGVISSWAEYQNDKDSSGSGVEFYVVQEKLLLKEND